MEKKVHVVYSGLIQGVGFRFTARAVANKYKVKGWVKNLPDGRVEIEAKADPKNLQAFLEDLGTQFSMNITEREIEDLLPAGEDTDFRVVF